MRMADMLMNNPDLMAAIENQLGSLIGKKSGYLDSLPGYVQKRVRALRNVQKEWREVEKEYLAQERALQLAFEERYATFYERRAAIIKVWMESRFSASWFVSFGRETVRCVALPSSSSLTTLPPLAPHLLFRVSTSRPMRRRRIPTTTGARAAATMAARGLRRATPRRRLTRATGRRR